MDDVFDIAWNAFLFVLFTSFAYMVFILVAFVMGEFRRLRQKRIYNRKIAARAEKARRDIQRRSRRLSREKAAHDFWNEDDLHYQQIREMFNL